MNNGVRGDIPKSAGTGVIHGRTVTCRYSIFQPAVTQWVAIGVISVDDEDAPLLAVETASNPKDVLVRLRTRVAELSAERGSRCAELAIANLEEVPAS